MPLAFAIGILSSMMGVGGGFLAVPALVILFSVPFQQAAGTSLLMIVFTAISSTFAYFRQKRIDPGLGILLALGSVPGSSIGAYTTEFFGGKELSAAFGIFIALASLRMILNPRNPSSEARVLSERWRRRLVDATKKTFEYNANPLSCLGLGFFGGFASGLFGVGGGIVMVPAMRLLLGVPMHIAVATSMFTMIFTSIFGVLTHLYLGNVIPHYALLLALGVIMGAQIGALIAKQLKERRLQMFFGVLMIFVGIRMVMEYLL
ncbi:MAG: sulfite exporter TauE/SafE family protein [Candidatus Bathyarchaeia archaeon]